MHTYTQINYKCNTVLLSAMLNTKLLHKHFAPWCFVIFFFTDAFTPKHIHVTERYMLNCVKCIHVLFLTEEPPVINTFWIGCCC